MKEVRKAGTVFLEEKQPRFYYGILGHRSLDHENDQTRSPLQEYIDAKPPASDAELRDIARAIQSGSESAAVDLIDKSLKIVRKIVRELNRRIWLDEDELINMAVEEMLFRVHLFDPESPESMTTIVGNIAYWGVLRKLEDYTRTVSVPNHIFQEMGHILRQESLSSMESGGPQTRHRSRFRHLATAAIELTRSLPAQDLEKNGQVPDPSQEIDIADLSSRVETQELILQVDTAKPSYYGFRNRESLELAKSVTLRHLNDETITEIGDDIGASRQRVYQMVDKYIRVLRIAYADAHHLSGEEREQFIYRPIKLPRAGKMLSLDQIKNT